MDDADIRGMDEDDHYGYLPSPWTTFHYFESKDLYLSESDKEEAEAHVQDSYISSLAALEAAGDLRLDERVHLQGAATRVYRAAYAGWTRVLRWLVERGADLHLPRQAILYGQEDSLELIVLATTPLQICALYNRLDAAALLLDAGARVNQASVHGHHALHYAAYNSRAHMCLLLLRAGADPGANSPWPGRGEYAEQLPRNDPGGNLASLLAAVRAAGSWADFLGAQARAELLELRHDIAGTHASSEPLYTRLFRDVPEDVFVGVFAFWPPATD